MRRSTRSIQRTRPDPSRGNVNQYTSGADFKQNQMIANLNVRAGAKLTLFSYYSLSYANSDSRRREQLCLKFQKHQRGLWARFI